MLQWATYLLFDLHSAAGGRMERKVKYQVKIKTVNSVQGSGKLDS